MLRYGLAIAFALLLTACGGAAGQVDQGVEMGPEAARELASEMVDATTDFQREILADGVVAREEYDRAVAAVVGCMERSGISARSRPSADGRSTSFSAAAGPGSDLPDSLIPDCTAEYVDQVDIVWGVQQVSMDAGRIAADRAALRECLEHAGVAAASLTGEAFIGDLLGDLDPNSDPTLFDAVTGCVEQYSYLSELE